MTILLVLVSLCLCGHFRIYCILSGSMEPTISTGSLILVDTDVVLYTEDIVTFQKQDSIITHRIV
ncbi:S26 family signal peptidase, partial [[Clostridium] innocuum]